VSEQEMLRRLDEAAHRYQHGDPERCITQAKANEIAARGGYPGAICIWGSPLSGGEGRAARQLADALAAAGLQVFAVGVSA
jgi:hypothetical protein